MKLSCHFHNFRLLTTCSLPEIVQVDCPIHAMCGSTYLCERLSSLVKWDQSFWMSQLTDKHLSLIKKVAYTQILNPISIKQTQIKDPGYWKILLHVRGIGIVPDWLIKFIIYFRCKFVSSRGCILFMVLRYLPPPPAPPPNLAARTEISQLTTLCWHTPSLTCVVSSNPKAD